MLSLIPQQNQSIWRICGEIFCMRDYGHLSRISIIQYSEVTMGGMASQITGISTVYSTVCSGAHKKNHQTSVSLAFVMRIHRWIPLPKGLLRVKGFQLMISSCNRILMTSAKFSDDTHQPFLERHLEYSVKTWSIPCLMMPWPFATPGFFNNDAIVQTRKTGPYVPRQIFSAACVIRMLKNDRKLNHILMFPKMNSLRKGLKMYVSRRKLSIFTTATVLCLRFPAINLLVKPIHFCTDIKYHASENAEAVHEVLLMQIFNV